MLKQGDKIKVISDWILEDTKNRLGLIIRVRLDNFVEIKWLKNPAYMMENYGFIFPLDELKKV